MRNLCLHVDRLELFDSIRPFTSERRTNVAYLSYSTALGVRCKDGVILGVEKLLIAKMLVPGDGRRIQAIDTHIGAATAGLMPDGRQLISRARGEAKAYRSNFGESITPHVLAERMGSFVHLFTVYWYLRPFGSSLLLAGYDKENKRHDLYSIEPTGNVMVRRSGLVPSFLQFFT